MNNFPNIITQMSNNDIARVKLNDPDSYNSLSLITLKSLIECFKNFNKDENIKVIILEGSGKGFSAGHNLKEIKSMGFKPFLVGFIGMITVGLVSIVAMKSFINLIL